MNARGFLMPGWIRQETVLALRFLKTLIVSQITVSCTSADGAVFDDFVNGHALLIFRDKIVVGGGPFRVVRLSSACLDTCKFFSETGVLLFEFANPFECLF